jgi:hypothetical protein
VIPDPKWLEILKASGWQTTAIAVAFGLFLLAGRTEWLPPLEPWMIQIAALVFLVCGCLALASMGAAALRFFPIQVWIAHWIKMYRSKRGFRKYIPHMLPKEREIIAYLLAKNQKMFTAEADGGHARTLLSRGIVIVVAQHNQLLDPLDVPMTIPDHLWDVLQKHKQEFPYTPAKDDEAEGHPWRVHWQEA